MSNDVVIKINSNNDTKAGFAAARKDADGFSKGLVGIGLKAGKELADLGPKMGSQLADGLTKSFGPASGSLVLALGGVGLAAAPLVGAAISAAVVGGAAGLGVVGGLALAAKDPRVKAMGTSLGKEVMGGLEQRAEVFVGPALKSIAKLRVAFREIGPDLDSIFENSSKYVGPLVDGLISGGKAAIGGIATAIARAGPIIDAFGDSFEQIGEAIGEAFETVSSDTDSAAEGFRDVTNAIVLTIKSSSELLAGLTSVYGWFKDTTPIDEFVGALVKGEDANEGLADSARDASNATEEQTSSLKELADELRAQTEPTFALLKAETDLGEARTKYNKAVKKYGENSAEARDELDKMAGASIDLQGAIGELGADFNGELSPALIKTLESAGLTKREIGALARQFQATKARAEAFEGTYSANVKVNGIPRAMAQLYGVRDVIRDIPRAVTIGLRITGTSNVSAQAAAIRKNYAHGGIKGAAQGMTGGDLTWVGERGPELVNLPTGSTVRTSGDSMRMMRDGARVAGGGHNEKMTLRADVDPTLDRTLIGLLMSALRLEIGASSGDVQRELGRN